MDEAKSRRGVTSVNARWGNLVAILAGDFLLARASEIAASLGTEVAGLLAATIGRLCTGQVREVRTDLRRLAHRGRLPRVDRGQDRRAHVGQLPHRRHHRAACLARTSRRSPTTAGRSAWSSRSSTTSSTWSRPTSSSASPRATTWSKACTRCRSSGRWPTPTARPTWPAAARRSHRPRRCRPRPRPSSGPTARCGAAKDVARLYAKEAAAALDGFPESPVVAALRGVGDHLIDTIP